ncbi:hypothetical protein KR222_007186, partial [Zaprionus bogoriensis]
NSNGTHRLTLSDGYAFDALCNSEIVGSRWTVILQRIKGGVDFNRTWIEYREGFGTFDGDFILGLDKIHRLTNDQPHELYIHMETYFGSFYNARYDEFAISGEDDQFRLKLGIFSGNTNDFLDLHRNMQFSTFDRDNDLSESCNCAEWIGGWWNHFCFSR